MDVEIGEVQAQVDSAAPQQAKAESESAQQLGATEKSHMARLDERRARRLRDRLHAY